MAQQQKKNYYCCLVGGLFRARGRQTWDDPVMHIGRTISQNARATLNHQTFHCCACLLTHVMKDISQCDMLSRSCVYSHLPLTHHPSKISWFSGCLGLFNQTVPVNKEPWKTKLSNYLCLCPSPLRELTATATDGLINVCILLLVITDQSWNRSIRCYATAAHECSYLVHTHNAMQGREAQSIFIIHNQ